MFTLQKRSLCYTAPPAFLMGKHPTMVNPHILKHTKKTLVEVVGTLAGSPFRTKKCLNAIFPYFTPICDALPGDWLDVHFEPGQTYREYLKETPATKVKLKKDLIEIVPVERIPIQFLAKLY